MTTPAAPQQTSRRAPWALWTALLAMLLALQASTGAIRPAAVIESGVVAAKLTLPAPLAAQFRDTGPALKAATQRLSTARPNDGHDGAPPPIPSHSLALAAPATESDLRHVVGAIASYGDTGPRAYRARAPPLPV